MGHSAQQASLHAAKGQARRYTDAELLDALRLVYERCGRISVNIYRDHARLWGLPSMALFTGRRYKTFNEALELAGLPTQRSRLSYNPRTEGDLLAGLFLVQTVLGEVPSLTRYERFVKEHPEWNLASGQLVRMRFRGWADALRVLEELDLGEPGEFRDLVEGIGET